jgi:hypothetical protein
MLRDSTATLQHRSFRSVIQLRAIVFLQRLLNIHHRSRTVSNYSRDLLLQCLRDSLSSRIVDVVYEELEGGFQGEQFAGDRPFSLRQK